MSDETVRVPAALVEALREALGQIPAAPVEREGLYPTLYWAARALVDAAERPTKRPCRESGHLWCPVEGRCLNCDAVKVPAAPVGEPLCKCPDDEFLTPSDCPLHGDDAPNQFRHSNGEETGIPDNLTGEPLCECGHTRNVHRMYVNWRDDPDDTSCVYGYEGRKQDTRCPCPAFTPAPLSSPRRTRDEGTEDEAQRAFKRGWIDSAVHHATCNGCGTGPLRHDIPNYRPRAARLAGEDDRP